MKRLKRKGIKLLIATLLTAVLSFSLATSALASPGHATSGWRNMVNTYRIHSTVHWNSRTSQNMNIRTIIGFIENISPHMPITHWRFGVDDIIFPVVTPGRVGGEFVPPVAPGQIARTEWNANRNFAINTQLSAITSYSSFNGLAFASVIMFFYPNGSHSVWS